MRSLAYTLWIPASFSRCILNFPFLQGSSTEAESGTTRGTMLKSFVETLNSKFFRHPISAVPKFVKV